VCLLLFVSLEKDLIHEALMHKLRHPNIVMLIAVIFEPGHYGVVFEYVKYGGLDNFLEDYEVRYAGGSSSSSCRRSTFYFCEAGNAFAPVCLLYRKLEMNLSQANVLKLWCNFFNCVLTEWC